MHQYYHTPGLTDLQAMQDQAQYKAGKNSENSIVHLHPSAEPCPKTYCIVYTSGNDPVAKPMSEDNGEG